jgi:hypothetical protein
MAAVRVKTAAERKAAERARRKSTGLFRFEFWLTPDEGWKVTKYVQRLLNKRSVKPEDKK